MKDRDDIEQGWSEATEGLAGDLLDILDGVTANIRLRHLARLFYREGWEDKALKDFSRLLRRAMRDTKKEIQQPAPEAAPEEIERPLDGGAVDQGVAGPAPLGEAPLDERPEVEGVGGAGKLKSHSWSGGLYDFTANEHGPLLYGPLGENPPYPTVVLSGSYGALVNAEILRLANRVRDLEFQLAGEIMAHQGSKMVAEERIEELETRNHSVEASAEVICSLKDDLALRVGTLEAVLRTVASDLDPYAGFVAGPIVRGVLHRIDQALSSTRLVENPGDVAGIGRDGARDGEGGTDNPGRVGEGADNPHGV